MGSAHDQTSTSAPSARSIPTGYTPLAFQRRTPGADTKAPLAASFVCLHATPQRLLTQGGERLSQI
jgi:hypothetical protein